MAVETARGAGFADAHIVGVFKLEPGDVSWIVDRRSELPAPSLRGPASRIRPIVQTNPLSEGTDMD